MSWSVGAGLEGRTVVVTGATGGIGQAVDNAQATSEKLKAQVGELKRKIDEGERTAGTLVARKNAAVAQRKVSEAMAGVGSADNAFAQLNRFEMTVSKEEATAKAFDQLANAGTD